MVVRRRTQRGEGERRRSSQSQSSARLLSAATRPDPRARRRLFALNRHFPSAPRQCITVYYLDSYCKGTVHDNTAKRDGLY